MIGNEDNKFELDQVSGRLRTSGALDRETRDSYLLTIQAMDSAGINSLSSVTEARLLTCSAL